MNRKAMVASLDAMIFVTVLAIVASTMIVFSPQEDSAPDASEICNQMGYIIIDGDAVAGGSVRSDISFWDYAACMISSGRTDELEGYVSELLDDMIGGRYGYTIALVYDGTAASSGEGSGTPLSDCNLTVPVYGGSVLTVELTVYSQR